MIFRLDGMRTQLIGADLNGDGIVSETETIQQQTPFNDMQPIQQTAETREAMREINDDKIDPETRMSSIDTKTRLSSLEVVHVLGFDTLVAMGVIPTKCLILTRQKKRLNVSLDGKGRKEAVEIANGEKKSQEEKGKFSLKKFAGMGGE